MFTTSVKGRIRRFHFVVVQWTMDIKEMKLKEWCTRRAVVLLFLTNCFCFCYFFGRSMGYICICLVTAASQQESLLASKGLLLVVLVVKQWQFELSIFAWLLKKKACISKDYQVNDDYVYFGLLCMVNSTYNFNDINLYTPQNDYYQFNQWYLFALVDIVVKILFATTQKMFCTFSCCTVEIPLVPRWYGTVRNTVPNNSMHDGVLIKQ